MTKINIQTIRARLDNYCYLIWLEGSNDALIIDPSESEPVQRALEKLGLKLRLILNTHHHPDHVGGNLELIAKWGAQVFCSSTDRPRVPGALRGLEDGERFSFEGIEFRILAIPGHTQGQIAFHIPSEDALFVGDTLFTMGCGRLFEGTPEQMWQSLEKIKALSPSTRLYFGHEYTERNGEFAKAVEPANSAIDSRLKINRELINQTGIVPAPRLDEELKVNPFLRAQNLETFTRLRSARDVF